MANDIEFLIKALEVEKGNLRRMIQDAISDGEYLVAHYHSEALRQVSQQLQTLRNLDDKLYEQKKMIRSFIKRAEESLKSDNSGAMRKYLEQQISKDRKELEQLENRGKEPVLQSTVLDQHLQLLLEKKARYIKIFLKKTKGFSLEIKRSKAGLKVVIPRLRSLRTTYLMNDDNLRRFLSLGFGIKSDKTKLILLLSGKKVDIITRLKRIISVITFEIFYFSEFEGDSFLEIAD